MILNPLEPDSLQARLMAASTKPIGPRVCLSDSLPVNSESVLWIQASPPPGLGPTGCAAAAGQRTSVGRHNTLAWACGSMPPSLTRHRSRVQVSSSLCKTALSSVRRASLMVNCRSSPARARTGPCPVHTRASLSCRPAHMDRYPGAGPRCHRVGGAPRAMAPLSWAVRASILASLSRSSCSIFFTCTQPATHLAAFTSLLTHRPHRCRLATPWSCGRTSNLGWVGRFERRISRRIESLSGVL
jgi:hypothetical protein